MDWHQDHTVRDQRLRRLIRFMARSVAETIERSGDRPPQRRGGEHGARRLSRRNVLKLGGAAAAATIASPLILQACSKRGETSHSDLGEKSIGIIGAGIAGLSAGHYLKKHGAQIEILEASGRTGGRIQTVQGGFSPGIYTENGGEFVDTDHSTIRSLCSEFGIRLLDTEYDHQSNGLRAQDYFINGTAYSDADILRNFGEAADVIASDLKQCGDYDTEYAKQLDHTSLADYLKNLPLPTWLAELLGNAYEAEFGLAAADQSSLNFIDMINTDLSKGFRLFGDSDERYRIEGGSSSLVQALTAELKSAISLNKRLTTIETTAQGVRVQFSDQTKRDFDALIVAIPFTCLRQVSIKAAMSVEKRECIDKLSYGNNCKLILGTKSRAWRTDGSAGYVINDVIQNGWDATQMQTNNHGPGAYTVFLGGASAQTMNMATPQQRNNACKQFMDLLEAVYPATKGQFSQRSRFANWVANPLALGSYPAYTLGQWTTISGLEAEPIGRIHFAGDHTSEDYQGYMNGAAESGKRVCDEIIASFQPRSAAAKS